MKVTVYFLFQKTVIEINTKSNTLNKKSQPKAQ